MCAYPALGKQKWKRGGGRDAAKNGKPGETPLLGCSSAALRLAHNRPITHTSLGQIGRLSSPKPNTKPPHYNSGDF